MNTSRSIPMGLTVTEWVLAEVADKLRNARTAQRSDQCFRLTVDALDQPELSIDNTLPGDKQFAYEGRTVLVVSRVLAERFKGRTLDINAAGDFLLI